MCCPLVMVRWGKGYRTGDLHHFTVHLETDLGCQVGNDDCKSSMKTMLMPSTCTALACGPS